MMDVENTSEHAARAQSSAQKKLRPDERGLLLVGLFKLSEALFFGAVGAGALHLVHKNFGELVMRIIDALPIDPESRFVSFIMDRADLVGGHQLRQAGLLSFLYASLRVIEGTGLMLRKVWAEYFTVMVTAAAMPWETYELWEKPNWLRVSLLLVNIAVLLYILWVIKRKREREAAAAL
jgi:uncharacterized membrane protein (DUF2068 family)